jgi:hypothetical protein
MKYEEILKIYGNEIKEYFKNVSTFPGQFEFNDFNRNCYEKMYLNNTYGTTVKELKEKIPGLKDMCHNCGQYYMNPRNKSHIKFDLMMGQFFENILLDYFNNHLNIKALHGDKSNKKYPDCMILGKDKGIIAYFEVKYHGAPFISALQKINRYCYEGSTTLDVKKVVRQLEIIESDIERPVFYIHWIDYPCLKGIFFETSEQVKLAIKDQETFERKERIGDLEKNPQSVYKEKIYSHLLDMGSFDEFVDLINQMRGN